MAENMKKTQQEDQKDKKLIGKQLSKVTGGVMPGSVTKISEFNRTSSKAIENLVPDSPPDGNDPYL